MTERTPIDGLTVKELVLRLDARIESYIEHHERRHDNLVPGDLLQRELRELQSAVSSHERTIQRIIGGMVFISAIGLGTLILLLLRISGVIP